MSVYTRIQVALDHDLEARRELARAETHPDPVEQRRAMVRAAEHLRRAADELDDQGRIDGG